MKHTWIQNNKTNKLLVFFNGWGCDEHQFKHLSASDYDVLMIYDYSNLLPDEDLITVLNSYQDVNIIAWSYGVWIAQYLAEKYGLKISKAVAVNGTTQPVHDQYGIAESIVQGTLDNLSERNMMKFQRRMLGGNEAWKKFEADKPQRQFDEQKEELAALIEYFKQEVSSTTIYQKAIVGSGDLIFSASNQILFWKDKAEITEIEAPHFCFYEFTGWDEIMEVN